MDHGPSSVLSTEDFLKPASTCEARDRVGSITSTMKGGRKASFTFASWKNLHGEHKGTLRAVCSSRIRWRALWRLVVGGEATKYCKRGYPRIMDFIRKRNGTRDVGSWISSTPVLMAYSHTRSRTKHRGFTELQMKCPSSEKIGARSVLSFQLHHFNRKARWGMKSATVIVISWNNGDAKNNANNGVETLWSLCMRIILYCIKAENAMFLVCFWKKPSSANSLNRGHRRNESGKEKDHPTSYQESLRHHQTTHTASAKRKTCLKKNILLRRKEKTNNGHSSSLLRSYLSKHREKFRRPHTRARKYYRWWGSFPLIPLLLSSVSSASKKCRLMGEGPCVRRWLGWHAWGDIWALFGTQQCDLCSVSVSSAQSCQGSYQKCKSKGGTP